MTIAPYEQYFGGGYQRYMLSLGQVIRRCLWPGKTNPLEVEIVALFSPNGKGAMF